MRWCEKKKKQKKRGEQSRWSRWCEKEKSKKENRIRLKRSSRLCRPYTRGKGK